MVVAGVAEPAAMIAGTENVPYSASSTTAPMSIATALPAVTTSATRAAPRASVRCRSKPIRKYEATAVRSKNTNISTRSWLALSPTIDAMNTTIHAQNRRASVWRRPSAARWWGM